jgi:hypothetical protein
MMKKFLGATGFFLAAFLFFHHWDTLGQKESPFLPAAHALSDLSLPGFNPSGPEGRFPVSPEFYLESQFKVSDFDLTHLYLKTAIKKGKIGVWQKMQMMQSFIEGRTKYKNAPQEVQEKIEAKFQQLVEKAGERSNYWRGEWSEAPDIALFGSGFFDASISLILSRSIFR